ncbi:MAG: hypothetical protein MJ074_01825 [Oscillospiraceae bacterium]|nr:hypothetical protein [Oscillospiraceae bacterium]
MYQTETTAYMHKLYAPISVGTERFIAKLTVEGYAQGGMAKQRAYNLAAIEMLPYGSVPSLFLNNQQSPGYTNGSIKNIAQLVEAVKMTDPDYHPKSSSKVVDEAGRPLVMYQTDSQGKEFSSVKPSGETDEPVYLNLQNPVIIDENGTVTNQGANADGQIIKDKDGIRVIVYAGRKRTDIYGI